MNWTFCSGTHARIFVACKAGLALFRDHSRKNWEKNEFQIVSYVQGGLGGLLEIVEMFRIKIGVYV